MKYYIIITFLILSLYLKGQSNKVYNFIDYNLYILENIEVRKFTYKRIQLSDSVFKDVGLFDTFNKLQNTFKISKNTWKVKISCKWKFFFNDGFPVNTTFKNGKYKYTIHWEKTSSLDNGYQIFKLQFHPVDFSISSNPVYLFTYKDGIIAINGHDNLLIREDKIYLNLIKIIE